MEKLNLLLKQISEIVLKEKILQEEKRKRGENFNIFNVLGLSTSEVRLHSAFIAELLNPNGDHGLGSKFMESFIDNVIEKKCPCPFLFESSSAKVYVEYSIGNVTDDYKEGGRIDLLIQDNNKQTIIIENKINAGDQPLQLYRYNKYANKNLSKEQYVLLYLTLNGLQPSDSSIGDNQFDYFCVSYREDILPWLEKCIAIAALYPRIRETITQYVTNLKQILSIMEDNNLDNYLEILTSDGNISTTIDILEHSYDIQTKIRENFIANVQQLCENMGFIFKCDDKLKTASNYSWMYIFEKKNKDIQFVIGVEKHTNADGFQMGFKVNSELNVKNKEQFLFWDDCKPSEDFPFGSTYLWSESGKTGSGRWWRWDEWPTLHDMTNGKMFGFIEKQLRRIKDENIFKRMKDIISKENNAE